MILATTMLAGHAAADTTLVYNNADGSENSRMYLTDGMAKITNNIDSGTALIFSAGQESFTIINHQDQSYMTFGKKEIAALGDVAGMIDRMLEEQLAQMPAGQREQMRDMMKSMIEKQMPKQAAKPEYAKSGQTATYNGFDCDVVVKTVESKKSGDFCVADYQKLGVARSEYNSINQFMKIAEKMAAQFGHDQSMNLDSIGEVLPVYYDMGDQKAYLTDVLDEDLSADTFKVPKGYNKQSLPKEMFQ